MQMRRCKQCGEVKAMSEYRQYYGTNKSGRPKGHYRTCKSCESINTRYKYLNKKEELSNGELEELQAINELYDMLREEGLTPPENKQLESSVKSTVLDMINKKKQKVEVAPLATPDELVAWMTKDLTPYTPEQLEEIYWQLRTKYRPQVGTDAELNPVYDETHKDSLATILDRFDEYEDNYTYD